MLQSHHRRPTLRPDVLAGTVALGALVKTWHVSCRWLCVVFLAAAAAAAAAATATANATAAATATAVAGAASS